METAEVLKNTEPKPQISGLAKFLAAVVTATPLVLILLGYGVSLALETMFGIPHATIFESSFELLDLASIALMESLPAIVEVFSKSETYFEIYNRSGFIVPVLAIAWVVGVLLWRRKKRSNKAEKPSEDKPSSGDGRTLIWRLLMGILFILTAPLLSASGVILVAVFITLLSVVPAIGLVAATSYLNDTVILPTDCIPLIGIEERRRLAIEKKARTHNDKTKYGAQCLVIIKDGDPIASGRVIFATSKAITLYGLDGAVTRVSLSDSVVQVIGALPTK